MQIDLSGKTAFVTGGSTGMGKGIARALVTCGANVAILALGQEAIDVALTELNGIREGAAIGINGDVADFAQVQAAARQTAEHFGGLQFGVNCAGIAGAAGLLHETGPENWRRIMSVNLDGVGYAMMAEIAEMTSAGGGAIVNIASVEAHTVLAGNPVYTASKHALLGLTKGAAADYARSGIRINSVSPGVIATPLTMAAEQKDVTERLQSKIPLGRIGQPDDIASAVVFLLSDLSAYTTGTDLVVDGAFLLRE